MAMIRAMEYSRRPPAERILSDPWAVHFIQNPLARAMVKLPWVVRAMSVLSDLWLPGGQEYVLVRARLVDDLTTELAGHGLKQLVILGAGFDTTIFRLQDDLGSVRVFEVDHPATQAVKTAALSKLTVPANVQFIPVDFEKDSFARRLISSGFELRRRSLFTWMGVSYYLTSKAVAKTLRQIAEICSPGSHLIFDYAVESAITGKTKSRAARAGFAYAALLGEPFLFGLEPDQASTYVARFGFKLIKQYDGPELQSRYCPPGRAPVDFTRIVLCKCLREA
jgi:methyltransferase (TIGR00027 family)